MRAAHPVPWTVGEYGACWAASEILDLPWWLGCGSASGISGWCAGTCTGISSSAMWWCSPKSGVEWVEGRNPATYSDFS